MSGFPCHFCGADLGNRVVDLGMSPLCESYVPAERARRDGAVLSAARLGLRNCFLVQLNEYVAPEDIFTRVRLLLVVLDELAASTPRTTSTMITERLGLEPDSFVVELASNDGYLLQYFVERGIPCLGIEPAANVAEAAASAGRADRRRRSSTRPRARELAGEGQQADLVVGNNVLAQVPDLNDFVAGIAASAQADRHGHHRVPAPDAAVRRATSSTPSTTSTSPTSRCSAVEAIFAAHGLTIFDVEELWTHGGSLRIYARPAADASRPVTDRACIELRQREEAAGYRDVDDLRALRGAGARDQAQAPRAPHRAQARRARRSPATARPGKGNTLLNYCGIRTDFIDFTVDRNPYKQGRFLPGTHIPIFAPERIDEVKPDYIFILPWNFKDEIMAQLAHVREWGAQVHRADSRAGRRLAVFSRLTAPSLAHRAELTSVISAVVGRLSAATTMAATSLGCRRSVGRYCLPSAAWMRPASGSRCGRGRRSTHGSPSPLTSSRRLSAIARARAWSTRTARPLHAR